MRKILSSNTFLALLLLVLISVIGYILFCEYEQKRNRSIYNELARKEKDLQNTKEAYEALLKDMKDEENINGGKDNSTKDNTSDIKNSDDNSDDIKKSDESSNNIKISETGEDLTNKSDEYIISKSIDRLNEIINESNKQIIGLFRNGKRLSRSDRVTLEEINDTFTKALNEYGALYNQVSFKKKNSIDTKEDDAEKKTNPIEENN